MAAIANRENKILRGLIVLFNKKNGIDDIMPNIKSFFIVRQQTSFITLFLRERLYARMMTNTGMLNRPIPKEIRFVPLNRYLFTWSMLIDNKASHFSHSTAPLLN